MKSIKLCSLLLWPVVNWQNILVDGFNIRQVHHVRSHPIAIESRRSASCPSIGANLVLAANTNVDGASPIKTHRPEFNVLAVSSAIAWIATSIVVLSYHPDPKFVNCSLKHNLFTMGQAMAFPLPLLIGVAQTLSRYKDRALELGIVTSTLWLAASTWKPAPFCFGYELIRPLSLQYLSTLAYISLGSLAFSEWRKGIPSGTSMFKVCSNTVVESLRSFFQLLSVTPTDEKNKDDSSLLYAAASLGLIWFTILPIVSPYPLATIPSILGKRLSRPAAAWTWLAAVACKVLSRTPQSKSYQSLRMGLSWGSGVHLFLILLKLIGLDDGGLLLPGTGLSDWYPAMMAVPFATLTSCMTHGLIVLAGCLM